MGEAIVLAGFLGPGRTTLLLEMAHQLIEEGRTVTVIVNEIGEVGIDGGYVAKHGLVAPRRSRWPLWTARCSTSPRTGWAAASASVARSPGRS